MPTLSEHCPSGQVVATTYPTHMRADRTIVSVTSGAADLSDGLRLRHPLLNRSVGVMSREREIQQVLDSWEGAFSYVQEKPAQSIIGLRGPQIGAVHAVHAHWSTSNAPATIVMPTGTGKTETMLSILVSAGCPKILVVVPTDALRTQIAENSLRWASSKRRTVPSLAQARNIPLSVKHNVGDVVTQVAKLLTKAELNNKIPPCRDKPD